MPTFNGPSYCQVEDVVLAVTAYNSGGTPGDISSDIVQQAIQQASAKISAWTGQDWGTNAAGQTVPVPDMIASVTIDIATYLATLSYRKNKPLVANDPVLLRYNDALADLKAIQEGMITPNPVTVSEPINAPGRVINTNPPTFTPYDSGTTLRRGRVENDTYPQAGTPGYW